jgi:hypothetical protein
LREFLNANRLALVLLVSALAVNQAIAAWAGYLSPDSQGYILLARTLFDRGFPGLQGHYNAVWPPGYPALIGLPTLGYSYTALFYSSKIVNALLWLACAAVVLKRYPGRLLPVFLIASPFVLHVASYTWSENLFVFALVTTVHLQFYALERAGSRLALFGALIAGLFSRYAFGLLLPALYLCRGITGGRGAWRRPLPVFAAALLLFAAYLLLNRILTGFVSGSPRSPAAESAGELLAAFLKANVSSVLQCLLPLGVAVVVARVRLVWTRQVGFLVLAGASYIVLIGVLRAHSAFDIYSVRLLGPGWFLIGLALLEAARNAPVRLPAPLVVLLCLLMIAGSLARVHYRLPDLYKAGQLSVPVARQIEERLSAFARVKAANVFYFRLAEMPPLADNLPELQFQGRRATPFRRGQGYAEVRSVVAGMLALPGDCALDFTPFDSPQALDSFLAAADPDADPALRAGLSAIFSPRAMVPCERLPAIASP